MRKCTQCCNEKEDYEFANSTIKKCLLCQEKYKKYYEANKEKLIQYQKEYREKNKEKISESRRAKYIENKEIILERNKHYYNENREKIIEQKKQYHAVPDIKEYRRQYNNQYLKEYRKRPEVRNKINEYRREKIATDPVFRQKIYEKTKEYAKNNPDVINAISSKKRAIKKKATVFEFDLTQHIASLKKWQLNRCFYCNQVIDKYHIEHIVPLSRGGYHHPCNITLSCPTCNLHKQDKIFNLEWKSYIFEPVENVFTMTEDLRQRLIRSLNVDVEDNGDFYTIKGNKNVNICFLSSFLTCDRNPDSKIALRIKQSDPDRIILFDYELEKKFSNIINMLKSKAMISEKIGARKLEASFITTEEAKNFLNTFHLMGFGVGTHYVGLKDSDGQLYGVGSFFDKGDYFENVRLAFDNHVSGGMSKIIKFLWNNKYKPVMSFVDSRYADGSGHETIGFKYLGMTRPVFKWVLPNEIKHYRYLSNKNKIENNLLWKNEEYYDKDNIVFNGISKLWCPPLHKILLEK